MHMGGNDGDGGERRAVGAERLWWRSLAAGQEEKKNWAGRTLVRESESQGTLARRPSSERLSRQLTARNKPAHGQDSGWRTRRCEWLFLDVSTAIELVACFACGMRSAGLRADEDVLWADLLGRLVPGRAASWTRAKGSVVQLRAATGLAHRTTAEGDLKRFFRAATRSGTSKDKVGQLLDGIR